MGAGVGRSASGAGAMTSGGAGDRRPRTRGWWVGRPPCQRGSSRQRAAGSWGAAFLAIAVVLWFELRLDLAAAGRRA